MYVGVFGCTGSLMLHGLFSSSGEQGLLSSCGVWDSHCSDFSCCRAWSLGMWALVLAHMWVIKPGLSSYGTWS